MAEKTHNGTRNGVSVEFETITPRALLEEVSGEARSRLGIKGGWEEFAELYRQGMLPDTLAVNELAILLESADGLRA